MAAMVVDVVEVEVVEGKVKEGVTTKEVGGAVAGLDVVDFTAVVVLRRNAVVDVLRNVMLGELVDDGCVVGLAVVELPSAWAAGARPTKAPVKVVTSRARVSAATKRLTSVRMRRVTSTVCQGAAA